MGFAIFALDPEVHLGVFDLKKVNLEEFGLEIVVGIERFGLEVVAGIERFDLEVVVGIERFDLDGADILDFEIIVAVETDL